MANVNPPFTWKCAPPPIRPDMMKGIDNDTGRDEDTDRTDTQCGVQPIPIETDKGGDAETDQRQGLGDTEDGDGTSGLDDNTEDEQGDDVDGQDMPTPSGDTVQDEHGDDSSETDSQDEEGTEQTEDSNSDNGDDSSSQQEHNSGTEEGEGQCQGLCELVQQHDTMLGEQAKVLLAVKQAVNMSGDLIKAHDRVLKEHHEKFQSVNAGLAKLSDRVDQSGKWANTVNEKLILLNDAIKEVQSRPSGTPSVDRIEIVKDDEVVKTLENQHYMFKDLLLTVMTGKPAWLVGPAGSFKTSAAKQVAETLDLPFYCTSVSSQTSVTALVGYMDAGGTYRPSAFRNAFEFGGVFLLDEVDAGNPNVLTAINASENNFYSFPDAMVTKHPAFRLIAAGNTYGNGASREYVGRNQLDGATLDRYAFIDWQYDNKLEMEIAINKPWCALVQHVREQCSIQGIKIIVSPRATLMGEQLLKKGLTRKKVIDMVIIKGANKDMRVKLERIVRDFKE